MAGPKPLSRVFDTDTDPPSKPDTAGMMKRTAPRPPAAPAKNIGSDEGPDISRPVKGGASGFTPMGIAMETKGPLSTQKDFERDLSGPRGRDMLVNRSRGANRMLRGRSMSKGRR